MKKRDVTLERLSEDAKVQKALWLPVVAVVVALTCVAVLGQMVNWSAVAAAFNYVPPNK